MSLDRSYVATATVSSSKANISRIGAKSHNHFVHVGGVIKGQKMPLLREFATTMK